MLRVEVHWTDSGTFGASDGWTCRDKIIKDATITGCKTVGFLMHEDDYAYWIALTHDPDNDHFFGTQTIKKTNVTKFIRLRARTMSDDNEEEGDTEAEARDAEGAAPLGVVSGLRDSSEGNAT